MKKLLSLPPNLVGCFHDITGYSRDEWFCTNDPVGCKLGSGGGSTWLLEEAYRKESNGMSMDEWLASDKRLLLHAGGQSRRLPAYAPSGKILTPIPVYRWERGQRLQQDLLSLEVPLYKRIMDIAPDSMHTMIVSGDVLIRATEPLRKIPEADVVCYGLWLGPDIAKDHGVYVLSRNNPTTLKCMLQKPSVSTLNDLLQDHFYLTDIGIWLFSDKAVKLLMKRSKDGDKVVNYDMYSTFGCALGTEPGIKDEEINSLKVAILPLPGGEFYHFGTSHEILSSTLALQNLVNDQRQIMHHSRKPHPSMFVQNSDVKVKITSDNYNLWIENSCIPDTWELAHDNIITGIPENNWVLKLSAGQCVDMIPIGDNTWAVRPYGYNDKFRGPLDGHTEFFGKLFGEWASLHGIEIAEIKGNNDLQGAEIYPVVDNIDDAGKVLMWMLGDVSLDEGKDIWLNSRRMSADGISAEANLRRLVAQRNTFRIANWSEIAQNYQHSVFYQVDLDNAAREFAKHKVPEPALLSDTEPLMTRIHDAMFRSELYTLQGQDGTDYETKAFKLLREGLTGSAFHKKQSPKMNVYEDQIVWSRSPVRIDLAGGWTDTPPYCLMEGGQVVNMAIELNGQPPLQAFVKPCREYHIVLKSIDLGASEVVDTYEQISDFCHVGSPFSIPKAALVLAGFHPDFANEPFATLEEQLKAFGCGIEVTMLSAIPAGSGLGTSSILASTVIGALNDFCGLGWDKNEIGQQTLVLEQLLTTGGGWQDQFGGILQGVKLLATQSGFNQSPMVRWLPSDLWTKADYKACHLLYYTGITRTAKKILSEIVRRMFLNQSDEVAMLRDMKSHAMDMHDAIQREDFNELGLLIGKTWKQNQLIDRGTNPDAVSHLTHLIDDYCLGYKLPGAGGGGYMYMVAKDPDAAAMIRKTLKENQMNRNARFVEMELSMMGLQISRS